MEKKFDLKKGADSHELYMLQMVYLNNMGYGKSDNLGKVLEKLDINSDIKKMQKVNFTCLDTSRFGKNEDRDSLNWLNNEGYININGTFVMITQKGINYLYDDSVNLYKK